MGYLDQYLVPAVYCGNCARPIPECPWMAEDRPVPGWVATPRVYEVRAGVRVQSYSIQSCPLYIPAPARHS